MAHRHGCMHPAVPFKAFYKLKQPHRQPSTCWFAIHLTCLPPSVCPMCSMQPTSTPVAYTSCTAHAPPTPPSTTSGSTGRPCRPRRHGRSRHRRRPRRPSGASTCRRRRQPRRPCLAVSHSNNPPCLDACACSPRCCDGLAPGPCASHPPPCHLPPSHPHHLCTCHSCALD